MEISKVDKNLAIVINFNRESTVFHDIHEQPFRIYGAVKTEDASFRRLPMAVAKSVSDGVATLSDRTAGIRVRFSTDAKTIVLRIVAPRAEIMPHMALCGQAGFDIYEDSCGESRFVGAFLPPEFKDGYITSVELHGSGMRSFTVNFPLYNTVTSVEVGLDKAAKLGAGENYIEGKPVLYYGSSITQGACASRPGNAYQAIISRRLNRDFVNLGFSGNALGEQAMAEYIAAQEISAFVCDYDHNAPTALHLEQTHFAFYATIRKSHPDIPIILVSRPDFSPTEAECHERRAVIRNTYERGRAQGDERLYFIDGETLFSAENRDCSTIDTCHPTDFGFVFMARRIGDALCSAGL